LVASNNKALKKTKRRKKRGGKELSQHLILNRGQLRAAMASKYYKEIVPQDVKVEIEFIEHKLWNEHVIFKDVNEFKALT
jgi:hypothetical protein